jgi:hypothetical protein
MLRHWCGQRAHGRHRAAAGVYGELVDGSRMAAILSQIQPDEVYHLAAHSHVRGGLRRTRIHCGDNRLGTIRLLEAIRRPVCSVASIRRPVASCSVPRRRPERGHTVSPALTVWHRGRCSRIGRPVTIARRTDSSSSTASCSTTNHPGAAKHSSRARSPARSRASRRGWINT